MIVINSAIYYRSHRNPFPFINQSGKLNGKLIEQNQLKTSENWMESWKKYSDLRWNDWFTNLYKCVSLNVLLPPSYSYLNCTKFSNRISMIRPLITSAINRQLCLFQSLNNCSRTAPQITETYFNKINWGFN